MTSFRDFFRRSPAPVAPQFMSAYGLGLDDVATESAINGNDRAYRANKDARVDDQLSTLTIAIKEHAVALKCEQEKVIADWQISLDQLTGKMATLQPLLAKSLQAGADREQALSRFVAAEKELKHCLTQAERDLAHYRPLAIQFESDLRNLRQQFSAVQSQAVESETECRKSRGIANDLRERLASTDVARQQLLEENNAYRQRVQKHDIALPTLIRETTQLKSELAAAKSDREHLEGDREAIAKKFAVECDEHNRIKEAMTQMQSQFTQLQNESQARIQDAEERAWRGAEKLSGYEQQIHDLEIRQSALLSKIDFLNRMNQRQRDDIRRQHDHIGNLEASNRQLLEGAPSVAPRNGADAAFMDTDSQVTALKFRAASEA